MFLRAYFESILWLFSHFLLPLSLSPVQAAPCTAAGFGTLPAGVTIVATHSFATPSALNEYGQGPRLDPGYFPTSFAYNFPALCAVTAIVTDNSSSQQLGLMLPAAWNQKFMVIGGYSFAGGINWQDMSPGAWYGMATVATDTGHLSTQADMSWAADPAKREAWGSTAMHGAVVHGKMLVEAYYSSSISKSYYSGCSTGGRQGLKEIQNYPDSFDGLFIGAPVWNTKNYMPWLTRIGVANLASSNATGRLDTAEFEILATFVQSQCDAQDGLQDNIISSPDTCVVQWDEITCGSANSLSPCLSSAQVDIARLIYDDYLIENGANFVHNGFGLSSEGQWPTFLTASSTVGFNGDYERYFLNYGANWPTTSYNASTVYDSQARENGVATADRYQLRANSQGKYPKIVMYHGMADGINPTKSSELYYNRSQEAMPDQKMTDFFRLFLVPGMQHCWDTPSPNAFAPAKTTVDAPWMFAGAGQPAYLQNLGFGNGWSVPGFENDSRYDAFAALMDWVEKDKPVDSVIATMWERGTALNYTSGKVLRQRPICAWPKKSVFVGGPADPNLATSWQCI